jgi:hypothetical protein
MKFLVLLFISISAFASPREEAQSLLDRFQSTSNTTDRLNSFSSSFLNLPYGNAGPLGEGEGSKYDQDPLYRFETFDCTTFVETNVSLALAHNVNEFENLMNQIRYENSQVDYLKRNHFPSLQWIPNNIKNGVFKEINQDVLPASELRTAEAIIDIPGWLNKASINTIQIPNASTPERESILQELKSHSSEFKPAIAQLEYIPISTLLARPELLKKIPSGSIISFVRPNWDLTQSIGTHMNVSHQGFIFQTKGGTILRHASASAHKVIELTLFEYLKSFANSPTLKGIHLLQINH